MELITNKEIFNEKFRLENKQITIRNLLNFCAKNNFIDEELIKKIKKNIQAEMLSFVEKNETEEDFNKDIFSLRESRIDELGSEINEFLVSKNNPYEAIIMLMNGNIDLLINDSVEYCKKAKEQLKEKIKYLEQKDKYLMSKSYEYKEFIESIWEYLYSYTLSDSCYFMLDGTNGLDIKNLINLNNILDKAILESSILEKFDKEDVLRLITKSESIARNISDIVLTNYILASLYKEDTKNLRISDIIVKQILSDIKNNMISAEDMVEVINDGEVQFSDIEKQYIINSLNYKFSENILIGEYIRN